MGDETWLAEFAIQCRCNDPVYAKHPKDRRFDQFSQGSRIRCLPVIRKIELNQTRTIPRIFAPFIVNPTISAHDLVKRAAQLAVARYGADRVRVQRLVQAMFQGLPQVGSDDFLERLVVQQMLTRTQAELLRLDLKNGNLAAALEADATAALVNSSSDTVLPAKTAESPLVSPTRSGYHLRTLGGYRLLRKLGEGGMGTVYLGYQESEDKHVAIKVLADRLANNPDFVSRFYREAKSGSALDHPHVVHCFGAGHDTSSNKHYLVLEFVDGPSARSLIDCFGRMSVGDAVHVTLEIARALEFVHARNYIHRDIKPDNILITQSGVAKLADLGLAKCIGEVSQLSNHRQGFGTPDYMPCEQAIDATKADHRSDIYSLGATFYHLLTGDAPFAGKSHAQVAQKKLSGQYTPASIIQPEVPAVLDTILGRMLAKDPAGRYATASDLIADLVQTNLDVVVPSFVDSAEAMKDPVILTRNSTAQATRPDLETPAADVVAIASDPDAWFLRFRERDGRFCKTRATTQQILQRLREGQLAATIEVSREIQGEFMPLSAYNEFTHAFSLPEQPKPVTPAAKPIHIQVSGLTDATIAGATGNGSALWGILGGFVFLAAASGILFYFIAR